MGHWIRGISFGMRSNAGADTNSVEVRHINAAHSHPLFSSDRSLVTTYAITLRMATTTHFARIKKAGSGLCRNPARTSPAIDSATNVIDARVIENQLQRKAGHSASRIDCTFAKFAVSRRVNRGIAKANIKGVNHTSMGNVCPMYAWFQTNDIAIAGTATTSRTQDRCIPFIVIVKPMTEAIIAMKVTQNPLETDANSGISETKPEVTGASVTHKSANTSERTKIQTEHTRTVTLDTFCDLR